MPYAKKKTFNLLLGNCFLFSLYSLMLSDYRIDKWYTIFTEVLLKTLRSAFLSASVADFISCSIEAMSPKINIDTAERIVILENLWKVFQVKFQAVCTQRVL